MAFIVTLIALLVERFFDWSHLRQWNWYEKYYTMVLGKTPEHQPYLALAFTIVPVVFLVSLLQFLLRDSLYGVVELLFQLVIVLYCLGPQNLWADTYACITALTTTDKQAATAKLKVQLGVTENNSTSLHQSLLNQIFIEANRRVFAPIFWFALLGPGAIVLYRMVSQSASTQTPFQSMKTSAEHPQQLPAPARLIESILDWAPARLMGLLFAVGANVGKVFSVFTKNVGSGLDKNELLVVECGNAALGVEEGKIAEDGSVEKSAINLLDRTFVILLVLVVILVWIM